MNKVPKIKLNNGDEIPSLGLGTYSLNGEPGIEAIEAAIDAGYRHFDTAFCYGNESVIGEAINKKIAQGVLKREDFFVVTKLWSIHHEVDKVETACRMSLKNLGLDFIDLYLMHAPIGFTYYSDNLMYPKLANGLFDTNDIDYIDTWHEMEKLVDLGLVKCLGISNFNEAQIERLLSVARVKPVNNQIECNPNLSQKELIKFCKDREIIVTSYCPLGQAKPETKTPDFLYDTRVVEIGKKYGKTAAQVILRFLFELGTVPIPKSCNKERIEENINIFDFKLTKEDTHVMDSFNNNLRLCKFTGARLAKYYPF